MKGTGRSRDSGDHGMHGRFLPLPLLGESAFRAAGGVTAKRSQLVSNYVGFLARLEPRITVRLANKMSPTKVLENSFSA